MVISRKIPAHFYSKSENLIDYGPPSIELENLENGVQVGKRSSSLLNHKNFPLIGYMQRLPRSSKQI